MQILTVVSLRWRLALLFGIAVIPAGATAALADASYWTIGPLKLFNDAPNPSLLVREQAPTALLDPAFVTRVGGISFQTKLAMPKQSASVVHVSYQGRNADGKRLIVHVNGLDYPYPVYDWQLKVISDYAESKYVAVVSLFGDGPDRENNFYVQVHPAFRGNLLGLRLLQADLVLMDTDELSSLPKLMGTNELTGPGEPAMDRAKSEKAAMRLADILEGQDINSWVLTDIGSPPSINSDDIASPWIGNPYYYFWRAGRSAEEQKLWGEMQKLLSFDPSDTKLKAKREARLRELEVAIKRINEEDPKIESAVEPTKILRDNYKLFEDYNKPVYEAVKNTFILSALFRLVKSESPDNWDDFRHSTAQIRTVDAPTPTRIPR